MNVYFIQVLHFYALNYSDHLLETTIVLYCEVYLFCRISVPSNGTVGNSKLDNTHFNMSYYVQRVKTNELIK